ncbi:hypothetical protein B0T10DRAFT_566774 [Thelonectria olida]|uniref:Lysine-specific metallo-endopeptidase domain-containing protein n=1 Tax=Thelonectria olida TaxID=1576542 RepID=A0A9P8VUH0_9HYPO|nr:hypothetical protein B0T10DRAFT_566774 [Thelonectria olida]
MAGLWLGTAAIFWALLFPGLVASAPLELWEDGATTYNATLDLYERSIEKRQVFVRCGDFDFSTLLTQSLKDAKDIAKANGIAQFSNMVDHLDLAISLYEDDGSGELKPDKATRAQRTFDEHNAFASYRMFISNHYTGAGAEGNREGFETLQGTRDLAKIILGQYTNYVDGTPVRWLRGGFPYVNFYCNDADVLSKTDSDGLTYEEATGEDDAVMDDNNELKYWVLQKQATQEGRETWVQRYLVCDVPADQADYDPEPEPDSDSDSDSDSDPNDQPAGHTRFGVPVGKGLNAYTYNALFGAVEEIMVFCPDHHTRWLDFDNDRSSSGLHYRDLHVAIGEEPTTAQKEATTRLLALTDFTVKPERGIKWLGDFLVATLLHESTHAEAFTGGGNALTDVKCLMPSQDPNRPEPVETRTTDPGCLAGVARGTYGRRDGRMQGHRDAEAFATYAMACWVNTVSWYSGYQPKERS